MRAAQATKLHWLPKRGENPMLNRLWIWFLDELDRWQCARMRAAYRREKLRALNRLLKRQDAWKN